MLLEEVKKLGFSDEQIKLYLPEPRLTCTKIYEDIAVITKSGKQKFKRKFMEYRKEHHYDDAYVHKIIDHLNNYTYICIGA